MAYRSRNWGNSFRTQDKFRDHRPYSFGNDRFEYQRDNISYQRELLLQQKNVKDSMISALQRGSAASDQSNRGQEFSFGGSSQGMPSLSYGLDMQSRIKEHLERELEYMDLAKREREFLKIANSSEEADRCSQRERQFLDRAYQERELRERMKPPEMSPRPLANTSGPGPSAPMNRPNNELRRAPANRDAEIDHLLGRISDMNRVLSGNQGTPLNLRARSPSPPPHFNEGGKRTNTRKQRARNKLEQERHVLIQRLLKISPDYIPPKNYVPRSFIKVIPLPVEEYPKIKFRNLLIGPGGRVIHEMELETGTKMRISSSSDSNSGNIIKKPVYLEITAPSPDALTAAENVVKGNIEMILQNHKAYVDEQNRQILNAEQKGCKLVRLLGINPEISSEDVCNLSGHVRSAEISLPNQKSPMHTAKVAFGTTGNLKETLSTLHDSRLWGPNQLVGVIMFAYDQEKKGMVQTVIDSIVPNLSKLTSNRTEVTETTSELSPGEVDKPGKRRRSEQDGGNPASKRQRVNRQIFPEEPFIRASPELAEESFQHHKSLTLRILKLRLVGKTTEEEVRDLVPDVQHIYPKISFTGKRTSFIVQLVFATPEIAEENLVALREKKLKGRPVKAFRSAENNEERWAKIRETHLSNSNGLCILVRDIYEPLPETDYEKCFPEAKSVKIIGPCSAALLFDDVETAAKVFRDGPNRELPGGKKFTLVFTLKRGERFRNDAQKEDGEKLNDDGTKEEAANGETTDVASTETAAAVDGGANNTEAAPVDFSAD